MDTELLKTFLEVEKTRHFGRAAENLYLTPAAISARIRHLEGTVGLPLFTRDRNNVGLTAAGERLKPYAENILDNWNRALQEAPGTTTLPQQLSIGGTPNLWDFVLQDYLHRVHSIYPNLSLRAECHDSTFLTSQLQSRQVDMVVLFDPLKLEGLVRDKIMEITLLLVSTCRETDIDTVFHHNYVQVDWGIKYGTEHARIAGKFARPTLYASTGRIALDFILSRGGAAYLPESLSHAYLKAGKFHLVKNATPIIQDVYMTYLQDSIKRPLMQEVTSLLANATPTSASTLKP